MGILSRMIIDGANPNSAEGEQKNRITGAWKVLENETLAICLALSRNQPGIDFLSLLVAK